MIVALLIGWLTFWRDTNSHAATARGTKAFAQKKYPAAVDAFRKANTIAPTPPRAFNLGTAEIAAGNREAGSSTLAANAYDYAIRDYSDALRLRPADPAAKRNLEIALRKRSMQQQSGEGGAGGNSQQPPKPKTREEQPRSDANTEALLRSVQQQEQEELSRMNKPSRRKAHVGW